MSTTASIGADQVSYRKKVGRLGKDPLYEIGLIGGLHLIMKAGSKEPLGAGPHRAVARHIAKRRNPDVEWTDLSKADWWPEDTYILILPKYEAVTAQLIEIARS